jgi:hypothetical protein
MIKKIIKHPLSYILLFAFLIRIVMIKYGLPFWLYNDEPPFVLTTLKMFQLKTLLPVLHEADFKPFMYYPPYISYLYIPFFLCSIALSWIGFDGNLSELQSVLASDPSIFFLTARVIMIFISILTIYLIYKITQSLTQSKTASLYSAILSSTSLMFISLSITGKHWVPILFFYTLCLFILTRPNWSIKKRYILSAITVGIGTGVSTVVILFSIVIFLWYITYDKVSMKESLTSLLMYKLGFIVVILSFIPVLLYPASLGFVPDTTLHGSKTLLGFITSPFVFPFPFIATEPVLVLLSLIGLYLGFKKYKPFYVTSIIFTVFYSMIFYVFFRFEYRFLLPLVLFLTIGSAIGINEIRNKYPNKYSKIFIYLILLIPILFTLRLSYLGYTNDSRIKAKEWLNANAETNDKVIVYANLMRIANDKSGILEQEFIDPKSLRTNDKNMLSIRDGLIKEKTFHALNLYTVENDNFYKMIDVYAKKNGYKYLIFSKRDFLDKSEQFEHVKNLTKDAKLIVSYGNNESNYSLSKTEIGPSLLPFFKINEFGPEIEIYKLNNQ